MNLLKIKNKPERQPTNGADFRLFRNGMLYPSEELVLNNKLHYVSETESYGYNMFITSEWYKAPDDCPPMVIFILSHVSLGQLSLFGGYKSKINKYPGRGVNVKNSLVKLLEIQYKDSGIFEKDETFVDLKLLSSKEIQNKFKDESGIYYIPYRDTTVRRENVEFKVLVKYSEYIELLKESSELTNTQQ